ncbi:MAG: hypothetical protein KAR21_21750 [Spirochaetales bacterium]|nr:hypothetical protein [Spirochaetales bacterium]
MTNLKIIVEKHPECYIAYPLGVEGVVIGQGNSYEEALTDVKSAIHFHIETFGKEILEGETPQQTKSVTSPVPAKPGGARNRFRKLADPVM